MHHWRSEFESLGMGSVAEAMVERPELLAADSVAFEATAYDNTLAVIEEAELLTGVEMPEPVRAAMLQRAGDRDEARRRTAIGAAHFREAMAEMELA